MGDEGELDSGSVDGELRADKLKVRDYIAETIGKEYFIPYIGSWNNSEEIDLDILPNSFVLKCNQNSGEGMYICKDKTKLDNNEWARV